MSEKEERIRKITKFYYTKPEVQKILLEFSKNREVVPRYFEGFGKRPDTLQYVSDIQGLVKKGATSFHASEELWGNPLEISSEMSEREFNEIREGWDLLIDIDSPFLDYSKIAAKILIAALESYGIKNYGIKFSGSKGFHIIVSDKAFPEEYADMKKYESFPEWPRAICEYLMDYIKRDYNREAGKIAGDLEMLEQRTNISKEDLKGVICKECNRKALKGNIVNLHCPVCNMDVDRRNYKITKRRLKCLDNACPGVLEIKEERDYFYCEDCKDPDNGKLQLSSDKYPDKFEEVEGVSAEQIAGLDLVLVAPRHLFRMPYSLHEKTALASVVLDKEEIEEFEPKMADPLKVKVREFMPQNEPDEARRLLVDALEWKKNRTGEEERREYKKYSNVQKLDVKGVTEDMFPKPIKKLLKGMNEGRKRGLFILITFLRSLNFDADYINKKIRDWNKLNDPPLKEGYVRSQIEWHLRQKKQILPPNYGNESFYKDLGLLDEKPKEKNPIVEVLRKARRNN